MTDLTPITALGTLEPRSLTIGSYSLRENSALALASLSVPDTAPQPFGLTLPEPGQLTRAGQYGAFWTGPNQWMVEGADLAETDFARALLAEAPEARVTEQTDGWTAFEIRAETAAQITALLERLANLPASDLAPGRATRTSCEHMSLFFLRRSDTELALIGMRTLAATLWHGLETTLERLEATS